MEESGGEYLVFEPRRTFVPQHAKPARFGVVRARFRQMGALCLASNRLLDYEVEYVLIK